MTREFDFLELRLAEILDRVAAGPPPPGGGSVAALTGALAAGLVTMAARAAQDIGAAAQGEALRARLVELAEEDAAAFAHALAALAGETKEQPHARDFWLGRALVRAADEPLRIAEAAADVATLAGSLAERLESHAKADAAAAAILGEAAARAAAHLVGVNLAMREGDERLARARAAVAAAGHAATVAVS